MNRPALLRAAVAAAAFPLVTARPAAASPEADVRATYDAFVKAQNDHDAVALTPLLWNSDNFLWITRGVPIWGRTAALDRFRAVWATTWKLAPVASDVRVSLQSADSAMVYAPIDYTIGPNDAAATVTHFLLTLGMVRQADKWVISSIIPVPPPPKPAT
jgi:ketosteroid isomerase-like protein